MMPHRPETEKRGIPSSHGRAVEAGPQTRGCAGHWAVRKAGRKHYDEVRRTAHSIVPVLLMWKDC